MRAVPFLLGVRLVLFGLKVKPYCNVSGKAIKRSVWLEPVEVERYLAGIFETAQGILHSFSQVMNASVQIDSINQS